MKIVINSQDLPFTIDTYQTFDGFWNREYMEQCWYERMKSEGKDPDEYEFDVEVNMDEVVKGLAANSVYWIREFLKEDEIVLSISDPVATYSPKEYNYRTDSYDAEWEIDEKKLEKYTQDHAADFEQFLSESGWRTEIGWRESRASDDEHFIEEDKESGDLLALERHQRHAAEHDEDLAKTRAIAALDFYLRPVAEREYYIEKMAEDSDGVYYENTEEHYEKKGEK